MCALRLYPAVPGLGVRCARACWGPGFGCAPPLLEEVLGCVCACVLVPRGPLHLLVGGAVRGCVVGPGLLPCPATPGWGVQACVGLCARAACTPPFLAGVCCVGVPAGLGFRLCPAPPGWVVRLCVRSCVCPACTPPYLGGRLWRGGVRVLPWVGFAPAPSPLVFVFGGGRLDVSYLGFVVSVAGT